MAQQIKLSLAPNAAQTLSGQPRSSASIGRRDCTIPPSAESPVASRIASATSASAEILRVRDLLRDLLLREDETEESVLMDEVSNGLNEIVCRLDHLGGLQMMFENWSAS